MDLSGKKFLVLGSANPAVEIVQYAQSRGAYVIVTDNLPDERSAAKKVADETAMVNAYDVDAIYELAKAKQVDGIFTGVHEIMLQVMQQVCERLNLPCYFTKEQWDKSQNKTEFKNMCVQYGIRIPIDYTFQLHNPSSIIYPVIVKPVDGCSGAGITIVRDVASLSQAVEYARKNSATNQILVEEYLEGQEFTAVYTIKNGEASLSCIKQKFLTQDHDNVISQSELGVIPCFYTKQYIQSLDDKVKQLLLVGIGLKNGCCFVQGIINDGMFTVFEMGLRMNGGADYRNISQVNKINYMHMMVDYALTGIMGEYDLSLDNPMFPVYSCIYTMYAHQGTITKREGLANVLQMKNVNQASFMREKGYRIEENSGLYQRVFRAYLTATDLAEVAEVVTAIQKSIKVEDENGNNMLFVPFNTNRLKCL